MKNSKIAAEIIIYNSGYKLEDFIQATEKQMCKIDFSEKFNDYRYEFDEIYDESYGEINNAYLSDAKDFMDRVGYQIIIDLGDQLEYDLLDGFKDEIDSARYIDVYHYVDYIIPWEYFTYFDDNAYAKSLRDFNNDNEKSDTLSESFKVIDTREIKERN